MAILEEIKPTLTFEKYGEIFELYENSHIMSYVIKVIDPKFGFKQHIEYNKPGEIKSPTLDSVCKDMAECIKQNREKLLAPDKLKKIKEIVCRQFPFESRPNPTHHWGIDIVSNLTYTDDAILKIREILG